MCVTGGCKALKSLNIAIIFLKMYYSPHFIFTLYAPVALDFSIDMIESDRYRCKIIFLNTCMMLMQEFVFQFGLCPTHLSNSYQIDFPAMVC